MEIKKRTVNTIPPVSVAHQDGAPRSGEPPAAPKNVAAPASNLEPAVPLPGANPPLPKQGLLGALIMERQKALTAAAQPPSDALSPLPPNAQEAAQHLSSNGAAAQVQQQPGQSVAPGDGPATGHEAAGPSAADFSNAALLALLHPETNAPRGDSILGTGIMAAEDGITAQDIREATPWLEDLIRDAAPAVEPYATQVKEMLAEIGRETQGKMAQVLKTQLQTVLTTEANLQHATAINQEVKKFAQQAYAAITPTAAQEDSTNKSSPQALEEMINTMVKRCGSWGIADYAARNAVASALTVLATQPMYSILAKAQAEVKAPNPRDASLQGLGAGVLRTALKQFALGKVEEAIRKLAGEIQEGPPNQTAVSTATALVGQALLNPVDVVRNLQLSQNLTLNEALKNAMKDGLQGLYRGYSLASVGSVFGLAQRDLTNKLQQQVPQDSALFQAAPALVGSVMGVVSTALNMVRLQQLLQGTSIPASAQSALRKICERRPEAMAIFLSSSAAGAIANAAWTKTFQALTPPKKPGQ